jgi:hypothetical protein
MILIRHLVILSSCHPEVPLHLLRFARVRRLLGARTAGRILLPRLRFWPTAPRPLSTRPTTPRPSPATTDQPQAQPNQQNHKRELHQAADQHERQEEERETVRWAAPVTPTFKPMARANLTARPILIAWAKLTTWVELALRGTWRFRPGLERRWPIVALRPTKALTVRLHTAAEGHKECQPTQRNRYPTQLAASIAFHVIISFML